MAQRHRTVRDHTGLRAVGMGLLTISYVCIRSVSHCCALDPVRWSPGLIAHALTAIGLLTASSGSAMVMLGYDLFNRVEISERWQPR